MNYMMLKEAKLYTCNCFSSPKYLQDCETELTRTISEGSSKYIRILFDISGSRQFKKSIRASMSSNKPLQILNKTQLFV